MWELGQCVYKKSSEANGYSLNYTGIIILHTYAFLAKRASIACKLQTTNLDWNGCGPLTVPCMVDPLTKIINLMCGECKVGFSVLFSYRNIKIWVLEDI